MRVAEAVERDDREVGQLLPGPGHRVPEGLGDVLGAKVLAVQAAEHRRVLDPAGTVYAQIGAGNLRAWADSEAAGHAGLAN